MWVHRYIASWKTGVRAKRNLYVACDFKINNSSCVLQSENLPERKTISVRLAVARGGVFRFGPVPRQTLIGQFGQRLQLLAGTQNRVVSLICQSRLYRTATKNAHFDLKRDNASSEKTPCCITVHENSKATSNFSITKTFNVLCRHITILVVYGWAFFIIRSWRPAGILYMSCSIPTQRLHHRKLLCKCM